MLQQWLSNHTFVNTRPLALADELSNKLSAHGAIIKNIPLFEIENLSYEELNADVIVMISPSSVISAKQIIFNNQDKLFVAPGPQTAKKIKEVASVEVIYPKILPYNSEHMYQICKQYCTGKALALVQGMQANLDLKSKLEMIATSVQLVVSYKTVIKDFINQPIMSESLEYWIITCKTSLDALYQHQYIQNKNTSMPSIVVVSSRLSQIAKELNFVKIIEAKSALPEDILLACKQKIVGA